MLCLFSRRFLLVWQIKPGIGSFAGRSFVGCWACGMPFRSRIGCSGCRYRRALHQREKFIIHNSYAWSHFVRIHPPHIQHPKWRKKRATFEMRFAGSRCNANWHSSGTKWRRVDWSNAAVPPKLGFALQLNSSTATREAFTLKHWRRWWDLAVRLKKLVSWKSHTWLKSTSTCSKSWSCNSEIWQIIWYARSMY